MPPTALPAPSGVRQLSGGLGATGATVGLWQAGEDRQQLADVLLAGDRIGEREVGVDCVLVAPPVSLTRDVASVGELDHDPVRGALGDPDPLADVAQADTRV